MSAFDRILTLLERAMDMERNTQQLLVPRNNEERLAVVQHSIQGETKRERNERLEHHIEPTNNEKFTNIQEFVRVADQLRRNEGLPTYDTYEATATLFNTCVKTDRPTKFTEMIAWIKREQAYVPLIILFIAKDLKHAKALINNIKEKLNPSTAKQQLVLLTNLVIDGYYSYVEYTKEHFKWVKDIEVDPSTIPRTTSERNSVKFYPKLTKLRPATDEELRSVLPNLKEYTKTRFPDLDISETQGRGLRFNVDLVQGVGFHACCDKVEEYEFNLYNIFKTFSFEESMIEIRRMLLGYFTRPKKVSTGCTIEISAKVIGYENILEPQPMYKALMGKELKDGHKIGITVDEKGALYNDATRKMGRKAPPLTTSTTHLGKPIPIGMRRANNRLSTSYLELGTYECCTKGVRLLYGDTRYIDPDIIVMDLMKFVCPDNIRRYYDFIQGLSKDEDDYEETSKLRYNFLAENFEIEGTDLENLTNSSGNRLDYMRVWNTGIFTIRVLHISTFGGAPEYTNPINYFMSIIDHITTKDFGRATRVISHEDTDFEIKGNTHILKTVDGKDIESCITVYRSKDQMRTAVNTNRCRLTLCAHIGRPASYNCFFNALEILCGLGTKLECIVYKTWIKGSLDNPKRHPAKADNFRNDFLNHFPKIAKTVKSDQHSFNVDIGKAQQYVYERTKGYVQLIILDENGIPFVDDCDPGITQIHMLLHENHYCAVLKIVEHCLDDFGEDESDEIHLIVNKKKKEASFILFFDFETVIVDTETIPYAIAYSLCKIDDEGDIKRILVKEVIIKDTPSHTITTQMLESVFNTIREYEYKQVNIITAAWNGSRFDNPLLYTAMDRNGIFEFKNVPGFGPTGRMAAGTAVVSDNHCTYRFCFWDPKNFVSTELTKAAKAYSVPLPGETEVPTTEKTDMNHEEIQQYFETHGKVYPDKTKKLLIKEYAIRDLELLMRTTIGMQLAFKRDTNLVIYRYRSIASIAYAALKNETKVKYLNACCVESSDGITRGHLNRASENFIRKAVLAGRVSSIFKQPIAVFTRLIDKSGDIESLIQKYDTNVSRACPKLLAKVDINSSYPAVAENNYFPVTGKFGTDFFFCTTYNALIRIDKHMPSICDIDDVFSADDGLLYHTKTNSIVLELNRMYEKEELKTFASILSRPGSNVAKYYPNSDEYPNRQYIIQLENIIWETNIKETTGLGPNISQVPVLIPTREEDKPLDWHTSPKECVIDSITFETCVKYSLIRNAKITGLKLFPISKKIFVEYIAKYKHLKEYNNPKREGDETNNIGRESSLQNRNPSATARDVGKHMMNDLFGKTVQKQHTYRWLYSRGVAAATVGSAIGYFITQGVNLFTKVKNNFLLNIPVHIGVFVYAYARQTMNEALFTKYDVLYSDTDSGIIRYVDYEDMIKRGLIHDSEFGRFKLEENVFAFFYFGAKSYMTIKTDADANLETPFTYTTHFKGIRNDDLIHIKYQTTDRQETDSDNDNIANSSSIKTKTVKLSTNPLELFCALLGTKVVSIESDVLQYSSKSGLQAKQLTKKLLE